MPQISPDRSSLCRVTPPTMSLPLNAVQCSHITIELFVRKGTPGLLICML